MPTQKNPPGWAMQEARDYLDSEEIPESEVIELASRIAAFDEPEEGISKIREIYREMRA